jgi:hypothetical protein
MKLHKARPGFLRVEIVVYDPEDFDTYPSVCPTAADVERRFGFTGGEQLVFTVKGKYLGQLKKTLGEI